MLPQKNYNETVYKSFFEKTAGLIHKRFKKGIGEDLWIAEK